MKLPNHKTLFPQEVVISMDLNTTPLHRAFWHYTLPSMAALLVSGTYQIVDGIFVGHFIGGDGLAGINLAWPWVGVLLAIGMMIGIGAGAQASISLGGREQQTASRYIAQGLWLLLLIGMPLGWLLNHTSAGFLAFQGASGDAAANAQDYLNIMAPASPLILASIALPFLARNLGAPRLATYAMLAGAISNILLDALFIAWLGWGLSGAALATVLAESLSVIICLVFLFSHRSRAPLAIATFALKPRAMLRLLGTGFSSMLMYLYISFSVVLHNILLLKYGTALHVAAYSIAGYLMAFYYMAAEGVSGGMQPLVSFYYGSGQIKRLKDTFVLACKIILGSGILLVISLLLVPGFFASVFIGDDEALLDVAQWAIRLHLFALFIDGFLVMTASWFQSLGMGRKATFITMGNMLIQLPFLALLPWLIGLNGVWLAVPFSNICLSLFAIYLLRREFKSFRNKYPSQHE